jgi:sodium/hydrogen antiporter
VERIGERFIRFTEAEGQLLNLSVFFVFGVFAFGVIQPLSWWIMLYAGLSLTLIRMLPVAVSLIGTRLSSLSMLFIGWFGPRGLASMVLGLIVVAEAPALAGRGLIEQVVALTVLLSVLLHGVTAAPLTAAYARRVEKMVPDAPEKRGPGAASGATSQDGEVGHSS